MLTVVDAAPDNLLTSIRMVKANLGIPTTNTAQDELIDQSIREASDFIENYTNRKFAKQRVIETVIGTGLPDMLLSLTPVLQLIEINFRDELVDATGYAITNPDAGIIQRPVGFTSTEIPWGTSFNYHPSPYAEPDWAVEYVGGYVLPNWPASEGVRTLPYDIERACVEMTKAIYMNLSSDGSITSYRIGDTSVSWRVGAGDFELPGIPARTTSVLNYWRRVK